MVGKLLKYDLKYAFKSLLIPYIVFSVSCLLLGIILIINRELVLENGNTYLISIGTGLITSCFIFGAIGIGIMSIIVLFKLCYKKMFGNEGYLTMSLPISVEKLYLEKILVCIILEVVNALIICLGLYLLAYTLFYEQLFYLSFIDFSSLVMEIPLFVIKSLYSIVLMLFLFTFINMGLFKQSKVLMGILFYFAFSLIVNTVYNVIGSIFIILVEIQIVYQIFGICYYTIISVVGIILTIHFLKNKVEING